MAVGGGSCYLLAHLILIPCVSIEKKERNGTATAAVWRTTSKNVRNVSSENMRLLRVCDWGGREGRFFSSSRAAFLSFGDSRRSAGPLYVTRRINANQRDPGPVFVLTCVRRCVFIADFDDPTAPSPVGPSPRCTSPLCGPICAT